MEAKKRPSSLNQSSPVYRQLERWGIVTSLLPAASLRMPALRRFGGDKVEGGSTFHDEALTLVPS
jgi:hypothetical protein